MYSIYFGIGLPDITFAIRRESQGLRLLLLLLVWSHTEAFYMMLPDYGW